MTPDPWLIVGLMELALLGIGAYWHSQERRAWQAERRDLLDRIQAPTWPSYLAKRQEEEKVPQKVMASRGGETAVRWPPAPTPDVAQARSIVGGLTE